MQVFLSHRTDADGSLANRVSTDLEARGIATWIAPRDVDAGTTWPRAIERGLQTSTHAAILISETTLDSRAVQLELQMAEMLQVEGKLVLVPVLLRRVELPPWLAIVQWVDFTGSYVDGLANLASVVSADARRDAPLTIARTAAVARARVHRVQRGERVDVIAARWYGSPDEWRRVLDLHPDLDPSRIDPGTTLLLDAVDAGGDADA